MKLQILENRLKEANVPFTKILDDTSGFYSIYYKVNTVENSNAFFKSIKKVADLDMCKGESGFDQVHGNWQRFKYWN